MHAISDSVVKGYAEGYVGLSFHPEREDLLSKSITLSQETKVSKQKVFMF